MHLFQFAKEEQERLKRFEDWWMKKSLDDPINFPIILESGEWDEQLRMFEDENA